jgi:hypothetical protein
MDDWSAVMVGEVMAPLTLSAPAGEMVTFGDVVMFHAVPTIMTLPWAEVKVSEFDSADTVDWSAVMVGEASDPDTFSDPVSDMPRLVNVAFVYGTGVPLAPTTTTVPAGFPV